MYSLLRKLRKKNLKIFFFAENCPQRKCVKFLACVCRSRATVFKQKLARASYERFPGYSSGVSEFRCFDAKFRFRFQFRTIQGRLSWDLKYKRVFFYLFILRLRHWLADLNSIRTECHLIEIFLKFWLRWSNK